MPQAGFYLRLLRTLFSRSCLYRGYRFFPPPDRDSLFIGPLIGVGVRFPSLGLAAGCFSRAFVSCLSRSDFPSLFRGGLPRPRAGASAVDFAHKAAPSSCGFSFLTAPCLPVLSFSPVHPLPVRARPVCFYLLPAKSEVDWACPARREMGAASLSAPASRRAFRQGKKTNKKNEAR